MATAKNVAVLNAFQTSVGQVGKCQWEVHVVCLKRNFQWYNNFQHVLKLDNSAISGVELEQKAQETLRRILASIPGSRIEVLKESPNGQWNFTVRIETPQWVNELSCVARSRAWPNELHAVAHRLKAEPHSDASGHRIPVLVAPYISKQSASMCLDLGLSWVDLAGNCELNLEEAFIKIQGEPNPYRLGRGTASLYSPKSASIIQALLVDVHRSWTTEELAERAHVSLGQVSSVKKLLEANSWIRASYGKTKLLEPAKVLSDWSQNYKPKRRVIRFFTLDSPHEFEAKAAVTLPEYAFTDFSAAQRYAAYTRHQRAGLYVSRWEDDWTRALGLKQGDGAANVTIYEQSEPLIFAETIAGVRCASPIQTYLDLIVLAGRGQDAASYLLETVIQPRWS